MSSKTDRREEQLKGRSANGVWRDAVSESERAKQSYHKQLREQEKVLETRKQELEVELEQVLYQIQVCETEIESLNPHVAEKAAPEEIINAVKRGGPGVV